MSGSYEPGPPEDVWSKGLSRLDLAFGTGLSLIGIAVIFGAPWFMPWVDAPDLLATPWYLLLGVGMATVTLYLGLRLLDFGARRVAVVHYRMVARDPEVVWGMVYGYLGGMEVPFQWTAHNPLFPGRLERRLSLDVKEGPGIDIVVKAPRLRWAEVMTVIELECPRKGAQDIGEVERLVDEALLATRRLDRKVVEAVRQPRLVLYGYDDALNKR
jgi:hypothetical protein